MEHPYFDRAILITIVLNTLCLTIDWVNIDENLKHALDYLNIGFSCIFAIESILKIIVYSKDYFLNGWNVFDFFVVLAAFIGIILKYATKIDGISVTTIIRTFRICRVFRLIKQAKQLNTIFNALVSTLPKLANVGSLLIMLLYFFAILGMNLFGLVKLQTNLNKHVNFQSFWLSVLTLLRIAT